MGIPRQLRIMAGIEKTGYEKYVDRFNRVVSKINRIGKREIELMDLIQRRQRGDSELKPMPFSGISPASTFVKCRCGWSGANSSLDVKSMTTHCPKCGSVFYAVGFDTK